MDPALIFFAALAAFLCFRLYTVLGTRGGHEPDDADRIRPARPTADDSPPENVVVTPDFRKVKEPAWAEDVKKHYPAFASAPFLDGAKGAYEMIVNGFASGALADIRQFIAPQVLNAFEQAVTARKDVGQTMEVTFVGIEKAEVLESREEGDNVQLVVSFQSDQIRVVRDAEGNVVDGDPNRIDLVKDVWTFSRPLNSSDPNWILSATDGAAPTVG